MNKLFTLCTLLFLSANIAVHAQSAKEQVSELRKKVEQNSKEIQVLRIQNEALMRMLTEYLDSIRVLSKDLRKRPSVILADPNISSIKSNSKKAATYRNYQSTPYHVPKTSRSSYSNLRSSYSSTCGAPTKKGGACRRVVSGGGYCWQHR